MARILERPVDVPVDRLLDKREVSAYCGWSIRKTEMLLTNGAITSDRVGNDSFFRSTFPYLGTPNPVTRVLKNNRAALQSMMDDEN